MELKNIDISSMHELSHSFRTVNEFYAENRKSNITISMEDSIILAREDSFHAYSSTLILNDLVNDSLMKIENILLASTFSQKFRELRSKKQCKYMKVLSVFESQRMYLIIYEFVMLQGHAHHYVHSELILK